MLSNWLGIKHNCNENCKHDHKDENNIKNSNENKNTKTERENNKDEINNEESKNNKKEINNEECMDSIKNYKLNENGEYECIDCGYSNSSSRLFKGHLGTIKHNKMYNEKLKNKIESKETLKEEISTEPEIIENIKDYKNEDDEYECIECEFIHTEPSKIKRHIETDKHRKNKNLSLLKKKHNCSTCKISFASKDAYKNI